MPDMHVETVVVGGGLAGLTAATLLARSGHQVVLCERRESLGGRATTLREGEFLFNQGPHALLKTGHASRVLKSLQVAWTGRAPAVEGLGLYRGKLGPLPTNAGSLIGSGLFNFTAKMELARIFTTLPRLNPHELMGETVRHWVERVVWQAESRLFLHALIRLATYCNDPDSQSVGAALGVIQQGLSGNPVMYLDGGWQTLVDGLEGAAISAGVELRRETKVEEIESEGAHWKVQLGIDDHLHARQVLLAVSPRQAAALVTGDAGRTLSKFASQTIPVLASCLDLGLASLPKPERTFALGFDQPTYYSVHSQAAELAPAPYAVVHCAKYLHPNALETGPAGEQELGKMLDRLQPGWSELVEARRFLPRMVVSNAVVRAELGGFAGRPLPRVPATQNLYIAGDWVGPVGMLAEAVFASSELAAGMMQEDLLG